MKICGLQKMTLLDFPGYMAATVFLSGCNFRCPYCHNSGLLGDQAIPLMSEDEFFSFLEKRCGVLEGVCITGGEPTLQIRLEEFIRQIRSLGYLVKLDTNGYRPDVLDDLCQKGLLDYVAMDIKSSRERYPAVSGHPFLDISKIDRSVSILKNGSVPYEFRTTVVKELHSLNDFARIGEWLNGSARYYLQNYRESDQVLRPGFTSYSEEELLSFSSILAPFFDYVGIR